MSETLLGHGDDPTPYMCIGFYSLFHFAWCFILLFWDHHLLFAHDFYFTFCCSRELGLRYMVNYFFFSIEENEKKKKKTTHRTKQERNRIRTKPHPFTVREMVRKKLKQCISQRYFIYKFIIFQVTKRGQLKNSFANYEVIC